MSKVIHNPALAKVVDNSTNSTTFVIEPLHAGYGNTLGNSLRRVLLSSIRGGSVVAFRIEGATHEFTTVPGVKEDVVDIMLNLKGVNVVVHGDEPVELRLEKKVPARLRLPILKPLPTWRLLTQSKLFALSMTRRNRSLSILWSKQAAATRISRLRAKTVFIAI